MRLVALSALLLGFFACPVMRAQDICPSDMAATISDLTECVMHAAATGDIDNAGIANSLLAKLAAAEAAQDRNQPDVAIQLLQAFINEVNAQAGQHIDAEHAAHMVMHAEIIIATLGG